MIRKLTMAATDRTPEMEVRLSGDAGSWYVAVRIDGKWEQAGKAVRVGRGRWSGYGRPEPIGGRTRNEVVRKLAAKCRETIHRRQA